MADVNRNFTSKTVRIEPAAPEGALPDPGALLGGYRLIRKLGQGGMGAVYEAEELHSGRRVALKVLAQGLESQTSHERFRREGLLAASINHPNTVYVFGTEEIDGKPVIAMELVSGGTLQDRVDREGPLPVVEAVDAVLQVMAGLEAAAARGVLHRDIKPSNCFVEVDGTVKVGDFGLSISSGAGGDARLTMTGTFMGTPIYCAPEQVRGDDYTLRGDIHAVGVTLYYLLTGRTPFEGDDLVRLLAVILERTPESPAKLRPDLPVGLCNAVLRCLEKQPARRFQNYAELRSALLPFGSAAPNPATLSLRFLAGCIDATLLTAASISITLLSAGHWDALLHPDLYPGTRVGIATLSVVLNLLYFGVLEGLLGASIGKRLLGIWVAGPNRGSPGFPRALLRALISQGLPSMPGLLVLWFPLRVWGNWTPESGSILLVLLFCTARRSNGFAALQDLLSRTRVMRKSTHATRPELGNLEERGDTKTTDLQMGSYRVLETLVSAEAGELLLGVDERLRRNVWIRKLPSGSPPVTPSLRNLARVGRLRWLNGRRSPEECWDAYEAGPGQALCELIRTRQPWNRVRFWLLDLAQELSATSKDQSLPATLQLDRIWITSDGIAKLLDFPAPARLARTADPTSACPNPQDFLKQVATAALAGQEVAASEAHPTSVAVPLPPHARAILADLEAGLAPSLVAERIKSTLNKLAAVSIRRRLGLIAGSFALPLGAACLGAALIAILVTLSQTQSETIRLAQCLGHLNWTKPSAVPSAGTNPPMSDHNAFEIYVAGRFGPLITNTATWTSLLGATVLWNQRATAEQLIHRRGTPTQIELTQATAMVEPYLRTNWPLELLNPSSKLSPKVVVYTVVWTLALGSALPALLAALLLRGGLILRALGLEIVRSDGAKASRARIVWRSVIAWGPLVVTVPLVSWLFSTTHHVSWKQAGLIGLGLATAAGLILWAGLIPGRGLQDRLAGTSFVPRE